MPYCVGLQAAVTSNSAIRSPIQIIFIFLVFTTISKIASGKSSMRKARVVLEYDDILPV